MPIRRRSSLTASSLILTAPPWTWRRASPLEAARPARTISVKSPRPASSSAVGISTEGRLSASAPSSKVLRAVSAACSAAGRPCSMAVISVARIFLTSLISEPPSFDNRSISAIGSVV
ncbi:hypothetical protein D9M72_579370 [compost metagenome]